MRFKQYLLEAESIVSVAKAYKKNIATTIESKFFMFRNSESHAELTIDNTTGAYWREVRTRDTSRSQSGYSDTALLMKWVDATWKGFPRRSWSYFATQNRSHAKMFGDEHDALLIIPADNVKKFAYMKTDFNLTKHEDLMKLSTNLDAFWHDIGDEFNKTESSYIKNIGKDVILKRRLQYEEPITDKNVVKIVEALNELTDNYQTYFNHVFADGEAQHDDEREFLDTLQMWKESSTDKGTVEDMMAQINPMNFGAALYTNYSALAAEKSSSRSDEIWFEGPYLAINYLGVDDTIDLLEDIYKRL